MTTTKPEIDRALSNKTLAEIYKHSIGDVEADHLGADKAIIDLLRELGYDAVCDAWEKVPKWYG